MSPIIKTLSVFVLLGGLIFVHELGHFLVAKLFRVKVLRFSLGFGPRIFGFKRGDTEYRVSWLPLGGYVKMAGEDPTAPLPPEDEGRGFMQQPPWKRFLIALAGPAMNLIFPGVIYFGFFAGTEEPAAIVGYADPERAGARQGLRYGDRIEAVDGEEIGDFRDLQKMVQANPGRSLAFDLVRGGERVRLAITPDAETDGNVIESRVVGRLGVTPSAPASMVAIADPQGPAAQAGIATFDRVVQVGPHPVETYPDLVERLRQAGDAPVELRILREGRADVPGAPLSVPTSRSVTVTPRAGEIGIAPPATYVWGVSPGTPAAEAGVQPGDRLVAIDGAPVTSMTSLKRAVTRVLDKEPLRLTLARGAETLDVKVTPRAEEITDEMRTKYTRYVVGVRLVGTPLDMGEGLDSAIAPPRQMVHIGLADAAERALAMLGNVIRMMTLGIGALFRGAVPLETVGGPIMLFDIAARSAERGIEVFLHNMALISINLGLLNLIPIPVLDGGHLLACIVESVRRRPLSMRVREVSNMIGLFLLLALMVFAFKNDIVRYFIP